MPAFVVAKLLPFAKTCWTDVHPVADLADRVGTFDANRVGEVAGAGVAFDLEPGLAHSYVT